MIERGKRGSAVCGCAGKSTDSWFRRNSNTGFKLEIGTASASRATSFITGSGVRPVENSAPYVFNPA